MSTKSEQIRNRSITTVRKEIAILEVNLQAQSVKSEDAKVIAEDAKNAFTTAENAFKIINKNVTGMQVRLNALRKEKERLEKIVKDKPMVTDHAVLRYLEKFKGLDVDALRLEIVAGDMQQIKYMDDGKIERDDMTLVVSNHMITTIYK